VEVEGTFGPCQQHLDLFELWPPSIRTWDRAWTSGRESELLPSGYDSDGSWTEGKQNDGRRDHERPFPAMTHLSIEAWEADPSLPRHSVHRRGHQ